jgi:ADP-ribose pyrophosphatase
MSLKMGPGKEVFRCPLFGVKEHEVTAPGGLSLNVNTLEIAHWVNVVPVTASGEIVLVEQLRFGTNTRILETPGGAVDPGEKDFTMAALRELEEETGLTTQRILGLPGYYPNPAIQGNLITFFVAFDVQPLPDPRHYSDPFELVTTKLVKIDRAYEMVRTGEISHALACLALLLAEPHIRKKFGV